MRRTILLIVALVLLVFGVMVPATQAAPSPEGTLNASFEAGFSGGWGNQYATEAHGGMGAFHAANSLGQGGFIPSDTVESGVRLRPGAFDQSFCSSNVFGIWWYVPGPDKSNLMDVEMHIWFDGTELLLTKSALKRVVDPQDFFGGGEEWWFAAGVPVLGSLEVGQYLTSSTVLNFPEGGDILEFPPVVVTIEDC